MSCDSERKNLQRKREKERERASYRKCALYVSRIKILKSRAGNEKGRGSGRFPPLRKDIREPVIRDGFLNSAANPLSCMRSLLVVSRTRLSMRTNPKNLIRSFKEDSSVSMDSFHFQ